MDEKNSKSEKSRERKIEKLKNLFKSMGKKGTPYDPESISDKCWNETEEEYQKKQREWLKNKR